MSDIAQPSAHLPHPPPPVADPTGRRPEPEAEAKTDVAVAPEVPTPPPPPAEPQAAAPCRALPLGEGKASGPMTASERLALMAPALLTLCADRIADAEAAAAARPPPVAAPPPRQGAPGGGGPDPRATVPRRVKAPSRPPLPPSDRPASDSDWRRLSADYPWMRTCDRINVLSSQATADQLRQAVERTSDAMRRKPVANTTSYLAMVCRTLVAETRRAR